MIKIPKSPGQGEREKRKIYKENGNQKGFWLLNQTMSARNQYIVQSP